MMLSASSWDHPELPVPAEKTGWLLTVQSGTRDPFFATRDGVLSITECPVMNKVRAKLIQKRLLAEGVTAELVSVAEYRRRLIAMALVQ